MLNANVLHYGVQAYGIHECVQRTIYMNMSPYGRPLVSQALRCTNRFT